MQILLIFVVVFFIPLYILPKRIGWGGIRKMLGVLMCLDNKVDVGTFCVHDFCNLFVML